MFSFLTRFKAVKNLILDKLDRLIQLGEKIDAYQNSGLENDASLLEAQLYLVEQVQNQITTNNQLRGNLKAIELQQKQILQQIDDLQRQGQSIQLLINKLQHGFESSRQEHEHFNAETSRNLDDLQRSTVEQVHRDFHLAIEQLKDQVLLLQKIYAVESSTMKNE